jgi:hypothetical protein
MGSRVGVEMLAESKFWPSDTNRTHAIVQADDTPSRRGVHRAEPLLRCGSKATMTFAGPAIVLLRTR